MDLDKLFELYRQIPPRAPRGTPQCKEWERTTRIFERQARRQGIAPVEAYKLCRDKSVSERICKFCGKVLTDADSKSRYQCTDCSMKRLQRWYELEAEAKCKLFEEWPEKYAKTREGTPVHR